MNILLVQRLGQRPKQFHPNERYLAQVSFYLIYHAGLVAPASRRRIQRRDTSTKTRRRDAGATKSFRPNKGSDHPFGHRIVVRYQG